MLLSVAYDGAAFSGFASQPNARTVAGELLGALRAVDPTVRELRGASRTDAGVHGRDQRVAFDPGRELPLTAWSLGLRRHLPDDIAVCAAWAVPRGHDPRRAKIPKTYRYELLASDVPDPLMRGRVWRVPELAEESALEALKTEASAAVGSHDFAAFRSARDTRSETTRALSAVVVQRSRDDPRRLWVDVTGERFMYNMVRILIGTLVDVARGRLAPGAVRRALGLRPRLETRRARARRLVDSLVDPLVDPLVDRIAGILVVALDLELAGVRALVEPLVHPVELALGLVLEEDDRLRREEGQRGREHAPVRPLLLREAHSSSLQSSSSSRGSRTGGGAKWNSPIVATTSNRPSGPRASVKSSAVLG